MDMIVTFLWHLNLLKSVNLRIMLIVPEPAYINEKAGAINMLISEGRRSLICILVRVQGPLICKLFQNPRFHTT